MEEARVPNNGRLSQLPGLTHLVTGHDEDGHAIIQEERAAPWRTLNSQTSLHEVYATSKFPPNLNDDADMIESKQILATEDLGLVHPGGIICRIVDFAPNNDPMIHRTQSLDYGVVLEGSVDMILDSGQVRTLRRGEIAVQRATMHGWRNRSKTHWARMMFVMQHSEPLILGGVALEQDLESFKR
ncbi:hypothetical protein E8E15_011594 [Penicillium rubens]|jgi:hypothetical protein|uniref:Pc22g07310 protein n=2 Tax=Penicillium chrysogenum species complex TaxID=254878 RepID=B6HQY1_PENRW|nr:uncharacterized protein N7525_005505 [Penicillium rubens]KZN85634.1 hypothetical protein EN45_098240 [Penicillium chrysogenum]CAP98019.1 Pc22g07310 [Penicillium rubens Wisconsin 54-1255]KAF3030270.1 hypothetical protein E8E15_011594 [Penicillium rubens]KAJ5043839.1 hypothetical protein NUH16_000632 [Penicillium rubens]KAJ5840317.1 hypothetical protein N7525_005505 [Penicillium rubens]